MSEKNYFPVEKIRAYQEGDGSVFDELYEYYKNHVYYMGKQYFQDEGMAEELVQEVFLTVSQKIGQLKSPEAFFTWMEQIAYNWCKQESRKRRVACVDLGGEVTVADMKDEYNPLPEEHVENQELKKELEESMDRLPYKYRSVLFLRYYEDLPICDIADIVGVPEGTVKSRINRAQNMMKKWLSQSGKAGVGAFSFLFGPDMVRIFRQMVEASGGLSLEKSQIICQKVARSSAAVCDTAAIDAGHAQRPKAPKVPLQAALTAVACTVLPIAAVGVRTHINDGNEAEALALLDQNSPVVVRELDEASSYLLCVEDEESGIDYDRIRMHTDMAAGGGLELGDGEIRVPKEAIPCYIDIPDKSGNVLRVTLDKVVE